MKAIFLIFIVALIVPLSAWAQKAKKTPVKKPVIREIVTVKRTPYVPPEYPSETEPDLWKEHSTKDGAIKIAFPSGAGKHFHNDSEALPDGAELVVMSAYTKNATYKLITRPVAPLLNNSDIEEVLESSISSAYSMPRTTIVSKKNVSYKGFVGKELVLSTTRTEAKEVQHARFFLLNANLIAIYVTLDDPNSGKAIEPWIRKFFDSLVVQVDIEDLATEPPKTAPRAVIKDGKLVSPELGLSMTIPPDLTIISTAEAALLEKGGADLLKEGSTKKGQIDEALNRSIRLVAVAERALGSPQNASLEIVVAKQPPGITANVSLSANVMLLSGTPYTLRSSREKYSVGANTFAVADFDGKFGEIALNQRMYVVMHRGYSIVIGIVYFNEQQLKKFEDLLATIELKKTN